MEDKDPRKLSRAELLEMLIHQSREVERLKAEQSQTRRQLDAMTDANTLAETAEKLMAMINGGQLPASAAVAPETQEQADEFVAKMRKGNGGYFKLWKIAEGDFAKYLRMHELMVEVENLKKEFE